MPSQQQQRKLGALIGLAVGDALGTTLEFTHPPSVPPFPMRATTPLAGVVGGGPFAVAAGEVTDDTQMAVALFTVLAKTKEPTPKDLASAYLEWSKHAFDIGIQTSEALSRVAKGAAPLAAGRAAWHGAKAGNGSLMRTTPIGVLLANNADRRRELSLLDSAITHFDPRCRLACAAHNACVAAAINGAEASDLADIAADEIALAVSAIETDYEPAIAADAAAALRDDLDFAVGANPQLTGSVDMYAHAGFVRVAFRLAFWELMHASSFADAVLDVANRGGDADTNAAVTGALYGSVAGIGDIPAEWRALVLNCKPTHPVSTKYHPAAFMSA